MFKREGSNGFKIWLTVVWGLVFGLLAFTHSVHAQATDPTPGQVVWEAHGYSSINDVVVGLNNLPVQGLNARQVAKVIPNPDHETFQQCTWENTNTNSAGAPSQLSCIDVNAPWILVFPVRAFR